MKLLTIKQELRKYASPAKAKILQRFFKTGKGQYGEGDIFIGVTVPNTRKVAKQFVNIVNTRTGQCPVPTRQCLVSTLKSKIHEERLCAVLILVEQFKKGSESEKKKIYNLYLNNAKYINNWDLVDLSAPKIVGVYLLNQPSFAPSYAKASDGKKATEDKPRDILYKLAKSKNLWEKRIAMLATFAFIREKQFDDTLKIAKMLLQDEHDLIHKAVGWMLREVGKQDRGVEEKFLSSFAPTGVGATKDKQKIYQIMPRTMLRYAIERFPEKLRQKYLKGEI